MKRVALFTLVLALTTGCSGISPELIEAVLDTQSGGELDEETVIAGLREALRIGSERTVGRTGVLDGFLLNERIHIHLTGELEDMGNLLRRVGLGRQVDELEVAMNRAAEEAAEEALDVFVRAIQGVTFEDAMGILRGGATAATDFLHDRTAVEIRERFHPIVVEKMSEVGLARLYEELAGHYNRLPFTDPAVDLDEYVTDEALDGLFTILGEEEQKIREDPVARTTELLRRVFG